MNYKELANGCDSKGPFTSYAVTTMLKISRKENPHCHMLALARTQVHNVQSLVQHEIRLFTGAWRWQCILLTQFAQNASLIRVLRGPALDR